MTNPLVRNAADESQVNGADRKFRNKRDKELNDLCFVLGTVQGRRFIWRTLEECGVMRISFNKDNMYITAFNEGSKNMGLKLLADVNEALPEAYLQMVKEAKQEQKSEE